MADPDDAAPPGGDELPTGDAELLRALGAALGPDDLPAGLVDRALELLAVADLDRELTALLEQAASAAEPTGVRGENATAEPVTFSSPDGAITVEVELDRDTIRGQLIGPDAAVVTLERTTGASLDAVVDALGRFTFAELAPGPARLRVRVADAAITTDWFVV